MRLDLDAIERLIAGVEAAGREVMAIYHRGFAIEQKDDDSPLTEADMAAHRALLALLPHETPEVPVLSEESGEIPLRHPPQLAPLVAGRPPGWHPGVHCRQWRVHPQPGAGRGRRAGVRHRVGSSLKFCLIAEGKADLYPRLAPTHEWDTAAAQAIVTAAGGQVLNAETLQSLRCNQQASLLNPGFIACKQRDACWELALAEALAAGSGSR